MRGRKNPGPVISDSVRRGLRAIFACTTELAAAALRGELRRVNQKGRETDRKIREKFGVKAHRANGQFEKSSKSGYRE